MLFDTSGFRIPPSDIVERLQRVDGNLGLRWQPMGDEHHGSWAITYKWSPNDPRRAGIQRGDFPPDGDSDIIVFLPEDCPVDQAFGYFLNGVRRGNTADIKNLVDRVDLFNTSHKDEIWKPVMDEAMEKVEANAGRLFAGSGGSEVPKSFGGIEKRKRGRPRKNGG